MELETKRLRVSLLHIKFARVSLSEHAKAWHPVGASRTSSCERIGFLLKDRGSPCEPQHQRDDIKESTVERTISEEIRGLLLKMQASTASPVTNTTTTKTKEQILIQSSGAMIVIIVLGIIVLLAILLIILKTYNRRTHVSRVLGASRGSKPRPKSSLTTVNGGVPLNLMGPDSASGAVFNSSAASEIVSPPPRASLTSAEGPPIEQLSTISESSTTTQSDAPSIGNT
ncbi:hypothetical protein EYF80_048015 [Liparis tanakae]|uniref:Noncompact myelin-associated protein n=1 Tax=Liparis tanakae TaxID=230148 RepID=A0A4Z2FKR5_9TELE|nr:hypothetical protein EYF80_048015 [Liparis tanakae]